jgi:hypothetical protein
MQRAIVVSLALGCGWGGCGGGKGDAREPAQSAAAVTRCVPDEKLALTRLARPEERGCIDQAVWDELEARCSANDPAACYQLAVCVELRDVGRATERPTRDHLRVACDGGIAEACTFRVGAVMLGGAPLPADGCADLLRGCGLGDRDACAQCTMSCEGTAPVVAAPTPAASTDTCCCPFASAEGVAYNLSPRTDCEAAGTGCVDDARCAE